MENVSDQLAVVILLVFVFIIQWTCGKDVAVTSELVANAKLEFQKKYPGPLFTYHTWKVI